MEKKGGTKSCINFKHNRIRITEFVPVAERAIAIESKELDWSFKSPVCVQLIQSQVSLMLAYTNCKLYSMK